MRETVIEAFEQAWQSSTPPDLSEFVTQVDFETVVELAYVDLERRIKLNQARSVESYFQLLPGFADSDVAIDFIGYDYQLRKRAGLHADIEDYLRRFPVWEAALRERLSQSATPVLRTDPTRETDAITLPGARTGEFPPVEHRRHESLPPLPGYQVLDRIAAGGMGAVYLARDIKLNRAVALKFPRRELASDAEGRERFLREARAAAKLRHANICPIHEVGEVAGLPYIAMGFVAGSNLRELVAAKPISARESAELLAKLARAVEVAHQNGIVHRDIKPANVLIEEQTGEPILTDFGLAKELTESDVRMTQTGQVMGTPAYMAPEQAAGKASEIGPPADVYALGAVLYELLCGRPVFEGSVIEILNQLQNREPLSPRKIAPRLHRDLETICCKAIAKQPGDRYESAAALADDLERFVAGEAILARPQSAVAKVARRIKRNPAISVVVTLCCVAVVIVLSMLIVSGQRQREATNLRQLFEQSLAATSSLSATETAAHAAALDAHAARLAEYAANVDRPVALGSFRKDIVSALSRAIETRLARERLSSDDTAAVKALLAELASRDSAAHQRWQRAFNGKQSGWSILSELNGDLTTAKRALSDSAAFQFTAAGFVRRLPEFAADQQTNPNWLTATSITSPADARIEADFALPVDEAAEFGLVIGSGRGHGGDVSALDFSTDGKLLASAGNGEVKVWDLESRRLLADGRVSGAGDRLAFGRDNRLLAIDNWGGLRLYDWQNDKEVDRRWARAFAVSRDRRLIAVSSDETIDILSLLTGELLRRITLASGFVADRLAISDDRRTLVASSDRSDRVFVYDWTRGEAIRELTVKHGAPISCLSIDDDHRWIAAGAGEGQTGDVIVWNWDDGGEVARFPVDASPTQLLISSRGDWLAVKAGRDYLSKVVVWDMETKQPRFTPHRVEWSLQKLRSSYDGRRLLAVDNNRVLQWDAENGASLESLTGHLQQVRAVALESSSTRIASGSRDAMIYVWDGESGRAEKLLGVDQCAVKVSVAASVEGERQALIRLTHRGASVRAERVTLAEQVATGPLRLRVERVHGLIRVWLNATAKSPPDVEFHDLFPLPATGEFALIASPGVAVSKLAAYERQAAESSQRLEFAERFFAEGKYESAAELFHAVANSERERGELELDGISQEARYKEAVCWSMLGRDADARALFEQLHSEPGQRWAAYATVQLWAAEFLSENLEAADKLLRHAKSRGLQFSNVNSLIPLELRTKLLDVGLNHYGTSQSLFRHSPRRLANLRQLSELERILYGRPRELTMIYLVRAMRLNGQRAAAIDELSGWIGELPSAGYDALDELAWMLRLEGRLDEAAALLDKHLQPEQNDERELPAPLLIDRAFVFLAQGQYNDAERVVEEYFRLAQGRTGWQDHDRKGRLLQGFLAHDRGDSEQARQLWSDGFRKTSFKGQHAAPTRVGGAANWLFYWLLGSLSGEASEDELLAGFKAVVGEAVGESSIALGMKFLLQSETKRQRIARELKAAWKSPRGIELARRIAYQQLSFSETVRDPIALLATRIAATMIWAEPPEAEDEALLWQFTLDFHRHMVELGDVSGEHLSGLVAAQLSPTLYPEAVRKFADIPELAGPLGYFAAVRLLRQGNTAPAKACLVIAREHAPADSSLARLIEELASKAAEESSPGTSD
ncbi:MAG: protein kinase [Planctomycetales bacterium]|nr:protein kinase [Planctomycetales bacterium]